MKYLLRALAEMQNYALSSETELDGLDYGMEYDQDGNNVTHYDDDHAHGHDEHFGVHIKFSDLYGAVVFLATVYGAGLIFARLLRMPSLVGEILVGVIMGPNLFDLVPIEEAWVLIGEIGLVLLVLEAGIDIDLTTLKLIGLRGTLIAVVGTALPVAIAICVAYGLGFEGTSALAAGCVFAPTSLGIAMNVLRRAGLVNTPTGQLIVAAAIIDDMMALVILSQLQAFTSAEPSVVGMIIPVVSAIAFLLGGGALAVFVVPQVLERVIFNPVDKHTNFDRDWVAMAIMFAFLIGLVPACYFAKASPLMGAFLAGVCFCSNDGAHHMFVSQFKRLMQWLLRIFFAASIGFQVPIQKFASGTVILHGLIFTTALLGKVAVGFMVPNFGNSHRFQYTHLRDCLTVGFSMAAEGEFAFVIAFFGVSNGLFPRELYASIVLAVLLSTIIAPFCLQQTLAYYNKKIKHDVFGGDDDSSLEERLRENKVLFWRIQIKSAPAWGLQTRIVEELTKLNLDLIDHRAWHPRRSMEILLNEIYAKDDNIALVGLSDEEVNSKLCRRKEFMTSELKQAIGQENAMVEIQRWIPHIEVDETTGGDVSEHIASVARKSLEASMKKPSTSSNIIGGLESDTDSLSSHEKEREDERDVERQEQAGRPIIQFGHLYRGKLEGMFRHESGNTIHGSNRKIGYGGYDSDEEGRDHHGRSVRPREPAGRKPRDEEVYSDDIEVIMYN